MPSPGGRSPGWPRGQGSRACGCGWGAASHRPPKGAYHTMARGQSLVRLAGSDVEGWPRAIARSGRCQVDGMPHEAPRSGGREQTRSERVAGSRKQRQESRGIRAAQGEGGRVARS